MSLNKKMNYIKWANSKIGKMGCWDMAFIKISVFAFALMIARLWRPLISLEWYWYLVIFVVFAIPPLAKMFKK
jgi:hypothetical protein